MHKAIEGIIRWDRQSLLWAAARRKPMLDSIMQAFTRAGDWASWTFLLLVAIAYGDTPRRLAFAVAPRLVATFLLCLGIKTLSKRRRPTEALRGFVSLLKNPDPYSFPSSHAACAWTVCTSLALLLGWSWGWPLLLAHAAAISYSRVHVGAHYPLDVFSGASIGLAVAFVSPLSLFA